LILLALKILVVDDNPSTRQILHRYLDNFGYRVETAESGEAAIGLLETAEDPFDLVLMDWKMPHMDGVEAIRRIHDSEHIDPLPMVMMVTAFDREHLQQEARDLSLDGLLVKPISQSSLLDAILNAFGKAEARAEHRHHIPELAEHIRGASILLVEDNEINQQVANELLTQAGLHVSIADDGQQGVEQAAKGDADGNPFDAILMDIQMPVMDGYTATRILRKDPRFKELPIIAMTANAMASDRDRAAAAGMNDHIAKPIDINEIFKVLAKWVPPPEERRAGAASTAKTVPDNDRIAAETAPAPIPALEGIDTKASLKRVGGNTALYLKILNRFHDSQGDSVQRIRASLLEGDRETAQRLAHTLKGLAGNIGAERLQQDAAVLERAIHGELEDLDPILDDTQASLDETLESLGALAKAATADSAGRMNLAELQPMFVRLRELLEDDDSEAMDIVDRILEKMGSTLHAATLQRLGGLINRYEFEEALEVLADLERDMNLSADA